MLTLADPHTRPRRSRRTMGALYRLVAREQWQSAITHIHSLADGDAVDQLFHAGVFHQYHGVTAIMVACSSRAPLELVQLMITKAKLDPRKRCLLAVTDSSGDTALHRATSHNDPAVVELLIREHPLALSATCRFGRTPLQYSKVRLAAITSLLTDATDALAAGDYAALAARVHGSSFALRCLVSPSYAARLAVRISLLLCLKTVHPDVPVAPTEPLDLRLAHARLCKDVWSCILKFG